MPLSSGKHRAKIASGLRLGAQIGTFPAQNHSAYSRNRRNAPAASSIMNRKHSLTNLLLACIAVSSFALTGCTNMTTHSLNAEGVRQYQSGNYQQAAAQFQRAIAANPRSANGYYNLASALHKSGKQFNRPEDLAQAEQLYNQCLNYDPNHTECYRGLAVLLSETQRQDAAYRLLEGWMARSPQLADPRIELARVLEENNNVPQASARLVEAIEIDPNNSRALTALGRLREVQGQNAQALADYQRSLNINRFQPQIAARVAALTATTASPMPIATSAPTGTRTVQQWSPTVRY